MNGSGFRKSVQAILEKTPNHADAAREVALLLRDQGVGLRATWAKSLLEPGLMGIRERSLGDPRLEALELCRFLIVDLGLDLVGPGVVSGDPRVMARLPAPTPGRRSGFLP